MTAEKRSGGGQVILSREATALLPPGTPGQLLDGGFFRFEAPPALIPRRPLNTLAGSALALGQCSQLLHPELLRKVITTHQGFSGDFRDVTCVFVRVGVRRSHAEAAEFVRELNTFFTYAQRESSAAPRRAADDGLHRQGQRALRRLRRAHRPAEQGAAGVPLRLQALA